MGDDATTIRQPSYAELLIDSMDRYTNGYPQTEAELTSSSKWTLQDQNYVLFGYFTRLTVTQIQFTYNLPTIIAGINDQISINGTLYTIPQGFYNPTTLAAAMQAAIGGAFGVFATVPSGILVISRIGFPFIINPPGDNPRLIKFYTTAGILSNSPIARTSVSGFPPSMIYTHYIDIVSSYLTKYQRVKDKTTLVGNTVSNVLARVYMFASSTKEQLSETLSPNLSPFIINAEFTTPKNIKWEPDECLANFDLTLYDEFGTILPWNREIGCEYSITLMASET
jgi:hypothetical protein